MYGPAGNSSQESLVQGENTQFLHLFVLVLFFESKGKWIRTNVLYSTPSFNCNLIQYKRTSFLSAIFNAYGSRHGICSLYLWLGCSVLMYLPPVQWACLSRQQLNQQDTTCMQFVGMKSTFLGLDYLVVSFCIEVTLWVVSNKACTYSECQPWLSPSKVVMTAQLGIYKKKNSFPELLIQGMQRHGWTPTKGWQKAHCGTILWMGASELSVPSEIRIIATNVTWGLRVRTFVFNNA